MTKRMQRFSFVPNIGYKIVEDWRRTLRHFHSSVKQQLVLTSPIPPSVNHYLAYRAIMKNGRPMAMSYKTSEAVKYQCAFTDYVKEEAQKQGWKMTRNPFRHYYMDCKFYFPRTDMDCNNYFKCMADAITNTHAVWLDDRQLCERVQGIWYDKDNPRIEIVITPVDYIGVFGDAPQLAEFEANCVCCTRYSRNCSLLKAAKRGYIQPEIDGTTCVKYKRKSAD